MTQTVHEPERPTQLELLLEASRKAQEASKTVDGAAIPTWTFNEVLGPI